MNLAVGFIHRTSRPTSPKAGYFYWVDLGSEVEIWFAPTTDDKDLILLNEKIDENLLEELRNEIAGVGSEIEGIEERLSQIKDEILGEIDLTPYLTDYVKKTDLEQYLTESEIEDYIPQRISDLENDVDYLTESDLDGYMKVGDIELTDSDYEKIADKVNEKTLKLTWQII